MRFFILLLVLLVPIMSTPFVFWGLIKDRKYYKFYTFCLAIILAVLGYSFIPNPDSDLTRYFILIDIIKTQSFDEIIVNSNGLWLQDLIFYFIGVTDNYHLLPAISAFITYYCVFYIIADFSAREKISHSITSILIVAFILTLGFQTPFSGIRNSWAFAMVFLAIYRDLVQSKRNLATYMLYVLPIFLHFSALVIIFLRLFLPVFKRMNKISSIVLIISYPLLLGVVITLFEKLSSVIPYLAAFTYKLNYTSLRANDEFTIGHSIQNGDLTNSVRKLITTSLSIFICILIFLAIYYIFSKHKNIYLLYRDYFVFTILLCLFTLGSLSYVIVFDRFSLAIIYISSPIFIIYWKHISTGYKSKLKRLEYIFLTTLILCNGFIFTVIRNSNYSEWVSSYPNLIIKTIFNAFNYL